MKRLGLVGGISWTSTVDYYRYINEGINARLGGLNFAECIVYSLNFNDFQRNNTEGNWEESRKLLQHACEQLEAAGAEGIVLCANTAHAVADRLVLGVPLLHIVPATARAIRAAGLKRMGLLGTKFTMEMAFYLDGLRADGIDAFVPQKQSDRDYIQQTLKEELGRGIVREETKARYLAIIDELIEAGAEGIILGCTEIPLLLNQEDVRVPVFDTTRIHSEAAVRFSVE